MKREDLVSNLSSFGYTLVSPETHRNKKYEALELLEELVDSEDPRLVEGFPTALYGERTGLGLADILQPLERAESLGLIVRDAVHLRPTKKGQQYLNDLLALFVDE